MASASEIPQRPYLLRAMHAWITDNGHTPHVVVDAAVPGVSVPTQYVRDGKIVLNLSAHAVSCLDIGNEEIRFQARFSGTSHAIAVPVRAILGIYARETGRGMIFPEEEREGEGGPSPDEPSPPAGEGAGKPGARRARLTVVK